MSWRYFLEASLVLIKNRANSGDNPDRMPKMGLALNLTLYT